MTIEMRAGLYQRGNVLTAHEDIYSGERVIWIVPTVEGEGAQKSGRWYTLDAIELFACELLVLARQLQEEDSQ